MGPLGQSASPNFQLFSGRAKGPGATRPEARYNLAPAGLEGDLRHLPGLPLQGDTLVGVRQVASYLR